MRKSDKATGTRGPDGKNIIRAGGGGVLLIWFPDLMVVVAGNNICRLSGLL